MARRLREDGLEVLIDTIRDLERFIPYGVEAVSTFTGMEPIVWLENTTFWELFPDAGWDCSEKQEDGTIVWSWEYSGVTFMTMLGTEREPEYEPHESVRWH